MNPNSHVAKLSMSINAPVQKVWDALTKPELVKKYFFGTDLDTDWQPGSPIRFRGSYEGKSYEDKGTVQHVVPGKHLSYTYWSSMAGLPDKPENYKTVAFDLQAQGKVTLLSLTQDNNPDEASKQHSEANWRKVLTGLKQLVETS